MKVLSGGCIFILLFTVHLLCLPAAASILEYIWPSEDTDDRSAAIDTFPSVPYELTDGEEDFIREASRWIGMTLSKLDLCHHRVVFKLKKTCHELNAEQMGKLAVMLLNCQSDSEGRPLFLCSDEMELRQCTEQMDPDMWNAYHLITNRAKAICASVRHEQFRGLTELTVNKLMATAQDQVRLMGEMSISQEQLQSNSREAVQMMIGNNERIIRQQDNIMRLSEINRAKLESNFRNLEHGKSLIQLGQQNVAIMLTDLHNHIDGNMKHLEEQSKHTKVNHDSLLADLKHLQEKIVAIDGTIEEMGQHIEEHHREAEKYYQYTIEQLQRINTTVSDLLNSFERLHQNFNRQVTWLVEKFGGSENSLQHLNIILLHLSYLLIGMIGLAFVGASKLLRLVFITAVPSNLLGGMLELFQPDILRLSFALVCVTIIDVLCCLIVKYYPHGGFPWAMRLEKTTEATKLRASVVAEQPFPVNMVSSNEHCEKEIGEESFEHVDSSAEQTSFKDAYRRMRERSVSSTISHDSMRRSVPRSGDNDWTQRSVAEMTDTTMEHQYGWQRAQCTAQTLRGSQCRGNAMSGTDFCRLHEPRSL
ncbi:protein brambleberry-like [Anopheles bellator]|uniref:protein brambleberry-like n=1 Tax=Anopheles bellator TaxID=139047 RepID=UPI002647EC19|nr:protein brambleberry-like [Anopheles bellator]